MTIGDLLGAVTLRQWVLFAGLSLCIVVVKALEMEMRRRPRATGRQPESPYEHRMLGLIDGAGLARPEPQYLVPARGHQYRVDFAYPALKLAVEVDGSFHNSIRRREGDRVRDEALTELGWSTLRITTREIEGSPDTVLSRLRESGVASRSTSPRQRP